MGQKSLKHKFSKQKEVASVNDNVSKAFEKTMDSSFVERLLSPKEQKDIQNKAALRNPGYDRKKLNGMLKWDVHQFEIPHLPAVIGALNDKKAFSAQRGLRVLDMAIRMPDQGWAIPQEFAQFDEALQMAVEHEKSINPEFNENYYVYITVDQKLVPPHKTQRRHGHHSDAYVTAETNDIENSKIIIADNTYVVADVIPTEFQAGPFPFHKAGISPENCEAVLKYFDQKSETVKPTTFPAHTVLKMTPYDIHTPGFNKTDETVERTFIKIQFSKQKYNLIGNTINPNLSYDGWTWIKRNPNIRNHRNSIADWNRPDRDRFLTIDPNCVDLTQDAPPTLSWAKSHFIWATKVEGVKAEPAEEGSILYTMHNDVIMTANIAQQGDLKITTSQGDQYFLNRQKFERRYHTEPDENGYFKPLGRPQKMLEVTKPVKLKAQWGAWQYAEAGSMLTGLGDKATWLVHEKNYNASYEPLP